MFVHVPRTTSCAVLVSRDRLEDVEALAVLLVDVLDGGLGGDHVAGADRLAPDELLASVDHHREVDADLRVEDSPGPIDPEE